MAQRIILTGSEGLIGSRLLQHLKGTSAVAGLDQRLGHDLTDEKFVKEWFGAHPAEYLVNCFALNDHVVLGQSRQDLFNVGLESIQEFLATNVLALFSVCREFARQPESRGIVNFSSTYGLVSPLPSLYERGEKHIGYSISKGAVIQLTRHLAVHLAPRVRVNCVVPGGVEHTQDEKFKSRYSEHVPLGRMMRPDELNGLIAFLCSDESTYVTGSIITVDGGWTAW